MSELHIVLWDMPVEAFSSYFHTLRNIQSVIFAICLARVLCNEDRINKGPHGYGAYILVNGSEQEIINNIIYKYQKKNNLEYAERE